MNRRPHRPERCALPLRYTPFYRYYTILTPDYYTLLFRIENHPRLGRGKPTASGVNYLLTVRGARLLGEAGYATCVELVETRELKTVTLALRW